MKRTLYLCAAIFIGMAFLASHAYALGLEVGAGYWGQSPSGEVAYDSSDKLDLQDNLNYETEYKPFGRLKLDMPLFLPNLYIIASPLEFEEDGEESVDFTFGNTTFDVTADFTSKLKMDLYDICLYYSLPFVETATLGKLNAELGINVRVVDFEAELTGTEAGTNESVTESESVTLGVPMIYAGIQLNPIDLFSIEAEGRGISYNANHFYDLIGRVKIKPFGPLFVSAGYRLNDIKIDEGDLELTMKFSGPFVEGGLFF